MARTILFAIVCIALHASAALAARMEVQQAVNGSWIYIQGEITLDDGPRFERLLASTRDVAVVVLDSPGGNLKGGVEIGTAIRNRQLSTLVEDRAICASACAVAWLGGVARYGGPAASIGFHSVYTRDWRNSPVESRGGNAVLGAYLNRMGLSDKAVFYITDTAPAKVSWLNVADAKALGIELLVYDTAMAMPGPPSRGASTTDTNAGLSLGMERIAYRFPFNHFAQSGEAPALAQDYFANVYAEDVAINGTAMPRAQLLERKRQNMERWPEQAFTVRPDSVRVQCNEGARLCAVSGVVDWEWSSWGRGARASGSSNFAFQLAIVGDAVLINGESEVILSRESSGPQ